jgi:hypothetical protein
MMKRLLPLALLAGALYAAETDKNAKPSGDTANPPDAGEASASVPETALDREISAFMVKHHAENAVLINNGNQRALDENGRIKGSEALGRAVNAPEVIIIAWSFVPDSIVDLYTSIKRLPNCAHKVRILYTQSEDFKKGSLIGYTIEDSDGTSTKLRKYDGKTPWLNWITESFRKDDAEQVEDGDAGDAPE